MATKKTTELKGGRVIILGTPHGVNVAGKRSVDGALLEYAYGREIAAGVKAQLEDEGYTVMVDWTAAKVPDDQLTELQMRVDIVNAICKAYGAGNCMYVSMHVNAAGDGKTWRSAQGWSVYTSVGQTTSDKVADCLLLAAREVLPERQRAFIRTDYSDNDGDYESNLYVLKNTKCAAVLTENLFMDNEEDVKFLLSEEGRKAIIELHCAGIKKFLNKKK